VNDEQLFDRRHDFLVQRVAGASYSKIAAAWNGREGRDPDDHVTARTVRSDCDLARDEILDQSSRDVLRGEHRTILLTMRRANFTAMANGDVDAAKVILSTLQREAEMFGLDEPKRSVVGVGTDIEFAGDLVGLIEAVGYQAPADLVFAARGERADEVSASARPAPELVQATRIRPFDLCDEPLDPEPETAERAHGAPSAPEPADPGPWSNL
jgi:hypothetical protein